MSPCTVDKTRTTGKRAATKIVISKLSKLGEQPLRTNGGASTTKSTVGANSYAGSDGGEGGDSEGGG